MWQEKSFHERMFWTRTKAKVYCFKDELSDEVFGVQEILAVVLDDSQLVNSEVGIWKLSSFSAQYRRSVQCCSFASIQESH